MKTILFEHIPSYQELVGFTLMASFTTLSHMLP